MALAEEFPDVGVVSAISPSCDWLIILEKIQQKQRHIYYFNYIISHHKKETLKNRKDK